MHGDQFVRATCWKEFNSALVSMSISVLYAAFVSGDCRVDATYDMRPVIKLPYCVVLFALTEASAIGWKGSLWSIWLRRD